MRRMFTVFAALLLAACNPFAVMDGADEEIAAFHTSFSNSQFDTIWDETHSSFKATVNRDEFTQTVTNMRQVYGEYREGEQTGFNINTVNGVTTTEITYRSTFANGVANETFIFQSEGEGMGLITWDIQNVSMNEPAGAASEAAAPAAAAPADSSGKPAEPAAAPSPAAPAASGGKPATPTQAAPAAKPAG